MVGAEHGNRRRSEYTALRLPWLFFITTSSTGLTKSGLSAVANRAVESPNSRILISHRGGLRRLTDLMDDNFELSEVLLRKGLAVNSLCLNRLVVLYLTIEDLPSKTCYSTPPRNYAIYTTLSLGVPKDKSLLRFWFLRIRCLHDMWRSIGSMCRKRFINLANDKKRWNGIMTLKRHHNSCYSGKRELGI